MDTDLKTKTTTDYKEVERDLDFNESFALRLIHSPVTFLQSFLSSLIF